MSNKLFSYTVYKDLKYDFPFKNNESRKWKQTFINFIEWLLSARKPERNIRLLKNVDPNNLLKVIASINVGMRSTLEVEGPRFCNSPNGVWWEKILFVCLFFVDPSKKLRGYQKWEPSFCKNPPPPKKSLQRTIILKTSFQTHRGISYQQIPISKLRKAHLLQLLSPNFSKSFTSRGPFNFPQMTHFPRKTDNTILQDFKLWILCIYL